MKLKELVKDWPPSPGGAYDLRGQAFPQDINVPIAEVGPVVNEYVACKCYYLGKPTTFDLPMEDKETAESAARVIRQHLGETLMAVGELEV
jgi:hypothetical protein